MGRCVLLADVMFDVERDGRGGHVLIPLRRQNCTVLRKVISIEDTNKEFTPPCAPRCRRRCPGSRFRYLATFAGSVSTASTWKRQLCEDGHRGLG